MDQIQNLKMNDGNQMPQLGFGLWQVPDDEAEKAVTIALETGYRSIDCAAIYKNEKGLGHALAKTEISRNELFITTKLWNSDQGRDSALKAFDESMKKLALDSLDLYLIHWASPKTGKYVESWKALLELKKAGRVKSVGVSNFSISHLQEIADATGVMPPINQVELHPKFQQKELRAFHARHEIATESWSPLGQGHVLGDEKILGIAKKHGKTPAQVVIRWHLQSGLVVIPKSVTPSRIKENFAVSSFVLDANDMKEIESMDSKQGRVGPDPVTADF